MGTGTVATHPRTIGWLGTVSLALGGSNQSLFLIGALIASQGTAAVPLLAVGLMISWAALPGWTELILMWPDRVGGIAATCAEAFRPYSPVLANLTGVCYWWGWVPTCGLTAILSADALHHWYLPGVPVHLLAGAIVSVFCVVNLCGVKWATRVAIPVACGAALLALLSAVLPVISGHVDWHHAFSFSLKVPFAGGFGSLTSAMAGLYLVGFAAPAFEAAACHVAETRDPFVNVPKAMYRAAGVATIYFVVLPVVWLGTFGPAPLQEHLATVLGPTLAPVFGGGARALAVWLMVLNMFSGTLQPLAGAARTLSQLSEDGLLPQSWQRRNRHDVPYLTTVLTAVMAIVFLQSGDPTWVIAAANLAYLIGISMPSLAVWLLRRNEPDRPRPYRAPRGTIVLGVGSAVIWLTATLLGFEQFGLPTVIASIAICYSGAILFAWRRLSDRRQGWRVRTAWSLHAKLSAAMVAVITLDGAGYLLAIQHTGGSDAALVAALKDIFVGVALLTINVGLVIPGVVSHAVSGVSAAAKRLAEGTLSELTAAMQALARGDLEAARARVEQVSVQVRGRGELGEMASSFNRLQSEVGRAAAALDVAREELRTAKSALARTATRHSAVAELGLRAMDAHSLDALVVETAQTTRAVLGAAAVVVYAFEDDAVRIRAAAGLDAASTATLAPASARLGERASRLLTLTAGQELVVGDWAVDHRGCWPAPLRAAGLRASIVVAMSEGGRAFGAVGIEFAEPRAFAEDELDTARAVANLLAGASERERAAAEMRTQALHDPLTGLPNRALFVDRLRQAIVKCNRRGKAVAVLFLDIDRFKLVNDSLGHSAGDELLRRIAARLEGSLRAGDTVARFGGDEFLIISEDVSGDEQAREIAARTLEALQEPFELDGSPHVVSVSMGIAVARSLDRSAEDLIREADAAMYRAKETGRDGYEVYDEVMRATAVRRLNVEAELRSALRRDELRLAYQPIVDLPTGRLAGVEALVRWEHPREGLLMPAEFIPVAEESGTIVALGEWVLRRATADAARWGRLRPDLALPVAVNLAARHVTQPDLVTCVGGALAASGLDPHRLHLEITESALIEPGDAGIDRLQQLKALGVSIVLDDFGTGYSSLAYVKRFPIDTLKIDRAFISEISEAPVDSSIVEAIVAMAQGLRVHVVAEGVETVQQARTLERMGCLFAQGHLFSTAVWPAEIDRMLQCDALMLGAPTAPVTLA